MSYYTNWSNIDGGSVSHVSWSGPGDALHHSQDEYTTTQTPAAEVEAAKAELEAARRAYERHLSRAKRGLAPGTKVWDAITGEGPYVVLGDYTLGSNQTYGRVPVYVGHKNNSPHLHQTCAYMWPETLTRYDPSTPPQKTTGRLPSLVTGIYAGGAAATLGAVIAQLLLM